jgi:hypothetical protein
MVELGTGASVVASSYRSALIGPNRWHFFAFAFDGDSIRIYVDGALRASAPASGSIAATDSGLAIGGSPDGTRLYSGELTDVAIYGIAVPESRILQQYRSGVRNHR